jgi:hypothetical protein
VDLLFLAGGFGEQFECFGGNVGSVEVDEDSTEFAIQSRTAGGVKRAECCSNLTGCVLIRFAHANKAQSQHSQGIQLLGFAELGRGEFTQR